MMCFSPSTSQHLSPYLYLRNELPFRNFRLRHIQAVSPNLYFRSEILLTETSDDVTSQANSPNYCTVYIYACFPSSTPFDAIATDESVTKKLLAS